MAPIEVVGIVKNGEILMPDGLPVRPSGKRVGFFGAGVGDDLQDCAAYAGVSMETIIDRCCGEA